MSKHKELNQEQIDDVIGMAWCDKTSFEMIFYHTSLTQEDVKTLMKQHLKRSSYRLWRKRVTKNRKKHEGKNKDYHDLD